MRILHIISSFSPGGAEVFTQNLLIRLSSKAEVFLCAVNQSKDRSFEQFMLNPLQKNGIQCFFLVKKARRDRIKAIFQLRHLIQKLKPDIVHTHLEYINLLTVIAMVGMKMPLVHTVHNINIGYSAAHRFFLRLRVSQYIAISDKIKNIINKKLHVDSNKITMIHNGIDLEPFYQHKNPVLEKVTRIIAIGRLKQQKNYPILFCAFQYLIKKLRQENLPLPILSIVGTGSLEKELKAIVERLGIKQSIQFLGVRRDIPDLLQKHDIYVMASKWEGLSISLIEAIASGIPVVATRVGSNEEIVTHQKEGLLVEPVEIKPLAEALYQLIKDYRLRKKMSLNAVKKANKFGINQCAKDYLGLYQSIVSDRHKE